MTDRDKTIERYFDRLDTPAKKDRHRREVNGAGPDAFVRDLTLAELWDIIKWARDDGRKEAERNFVLQKINENFRIGKGKA